MSRFPQPQIFPLTFPRRGFNEVAAFSETPADYAVATLNVRAFDPATGRLRGGQRAGIARWLDAPLGNAPLQLLRQTNTDNAVTAPRWRTSYVYDFNQTVGRYQSAAADLAQKSWDYTVNGTGKLAYVPAITTMPASFNSGPVRADKLRFSLSLHLPADTPADVSAFNLTVYPSNQSLSIPVQFLDVAFFKQKVLVFVSRDINTTWLEEQIFADEAVAVTITIEAGTVTVIINGTTTLTFNIPAPNQLPLTAMLYTASAFQLLDHQAAWFDDVKLEALAASIDTFDPKIVSVCAGTVKIGTAETGFVTPANGADALNASGEISAAQAFGKLYFVDGTNLKALDLATNSVASLAPSAGTPPAGARLATLYRGRLVLSRTAADPHNWFMSKAGDPTNWDYADKTAVGAVAGNNSEAGRVGDIITALIPYADTFMLMGNPNSLYVMRGDPKAGGSIDLVSNQVGIVGPTAFCQDPTGTIYFLARNGLYAYSHGGGLRNLSLGRLDQTLGAIDLTSHRIHMAFNPQDLSVYIVAAPADPNVPATVIVWDSRVDGFWIDRYPAEIGPSCMATMQGGDENSRLLLLGGNDGRIRRFDHRALSDDGTAIASRVRFAPRSLGNAETIGKIVATRIVWAGGTPGKVHADYRFVVGRDAQDAATAAATPTNGSNTNPNGQTLDRTRMRGGAVCLEISNETDATTWAVESVQLHVLPGGRLR